MRKYFSRIVLMLGNVVTGLSILGPAGMLADLARGLHVGIHDTGLLVTYGAVVLCMRVTHISAAVFDASRTAGAVRSAYETSAIGAPPDGGLE